MSETAEHRAASGSPSPSALGDLFVRVATALSAALPFDRAELALSNEPEGVRVLDLGASGGEIAEWTALRSDYSERLWPKADGAPEVVRDAEAELDPACSADRRLLGQGARALLASSLQFEGRPLGRLFLSTRTAGAFEAAHAATLWPVAELLAAAVEHDRQWRRQAEHLARREKLEALLPKIAEALDVRKVFLGLSRVIQEIVPHDVLAFALLSPDRGGVQVQAATHEGLRELPEYRFSSPEESLDANWRYLLAYDLAPVGEDALRARISPREAPETIEVVVRPGLAWTRFIASAGIRSTLRVPIRAKDETVGGIAFFSRRPFAYDGDDGALVARISDHVALALSYQALAEEERRIALAEERSAQLEERVEVLSAELERLSAHRAIGRSTAWKNVLALATQVAETDTTVLITGESGTGKEVVARYIHRGSPRARGPFVALNCAALPENLLESELFGHERGAFTGAHTSRPGKIEQAAGGVLFLDEVGEMPPVVQAKFLRVLQEREFERLGGGKTLKANVRILAATNRDPKKAIEIGQFREDLYYRLSVFEIMLPPLRERREDVPVLAEAFLSEIGKNVGRPAAGLSEEAREHLVAHSWPGNVRELRNVIERAVILCQGGWIARDHLPAAVVRPPSEVAAAATAPEAEFPAGGVQLDAVERDLVEKALVRARQNKTQAAKLLGLSRGQLYSLMRRHGLTEARR